MGERKYTQPNFREFGTVESITTQNDKIGSADDGVDFEGLDGTIDKDAS